MPNLARVTGRVLGCLLAFDVVGVALTLLVDMVVVLHRRYESSSLLAYAIWFVVGVFCAVFISMPRNDEDDPDSAEGRRRGLALVAVTAAVAAVLALLASFVWSGSGASEAVAPDHRGVTITYLTTVVLAVAWARFVLFRAPGRVEPRMRTAPPPDVGLRRKVARVIVPGRLERRRAPPAAFEPAGPWQTLSFMLGVPALLFMDASFFLLGPFDYFDRWTNPLLIASLAVGLAWGIAAARWRGARQWLWVAHAPLLAGTICYLLAVVLGGLLVGFGVHEGVSQIISYVAFGIGFLLGCAAVFGRLVEVFEQTTSGTVRP